MISEMTSKQLTGQGQPECARWLSSACCIVLGLSGLTVGCTGAGSGSGGINQDEFDSIYANSIPYAVSPDDPDFCDFGLAFRNDSTLVFSPPLVLEDGFTYEISVDADFGPDGVYPTPLVCTLAFPTDRITMSCPGFNFPSDTKFDGWPGPAFEEGQPSHLATFQWLRLTPQAHISVSRDGRPLFDSDVTFDVTESDCPGAVFDEFPDLPDYGQTYTYARATIDLSVTR